jgi:pantothenate kinase-related protein Tda10
MEPEQVKAEALGRVLKGVALNEDELAVLQTRDAFETQLINYEGCELGRKLDDRIRTFRVVDFELKARGLSVLPLELWTRHLPLAELLVHWANIKTPCLVGIAGVPGTGKTSLATTLAMITNRYGSSTAVVSLDDFYLTPAERQNLGYKWRAIPGSHDLAMLRKFIEQVKSGEDSLLIPRYDTRAEKRLEPSICERPRLVLLEGWLVGALIPGYEFLAAALDHLIYLDADLEWSHQSRLNREARIRRESHGKLGLSESETERFWQEALLPGAIQWVQPLKQRADVLIEIGPDYAIHSVVIRTASPGDSPGV